MAVRLRKLSSCFFKCLLVSALAIRAFAQPFAYTANAAQNTVSVLNLGTYSVTGSVSVPGGPAGLAVTPDGSKVYVALATSNMVAVISAASKSVLATISTGNTPKQVAISPNGSLVYVVNQGSNQVSVISSTSNSVVASIGVGSYPSGIALSSDGTRAYVANLSSNNVSVIDTSSNQVINTFATPSAPDAIAVAPNGQNVYVASEGLSNVTVYDISGGLVATITGFNYPTSMAITPNSSRIFVTNGDGASVSVIDAGSNKVIASVGVGMIPMFVASSTDGTQAYVVNEFGFSLSVINTSSNAVTTTVPGIGVYPVAVATVPPVATVSTVLPPPPCTFTMTPGSLVFGVGGGSSSINISASAAGCQWTASGPTWATLSPASGTGSGAVNVSVAANAAVQALSGTLVVASQNFPVSQAGVVFAGVRVNCGGPSMTDSAGNLWQADAGRNYSVTMASIANTTTPALYQKEAFAAGSGLSYQLSVPNGAFTVKLHFAEIYLTSPGQRVVNIIINGITVMGSFDILQQTSANTAYDLTFPTSVTNGQVTIQIVPVVGTASLSGIEIY